MEDDIVLTAFRSNLYLVSI